MEEKTRRNSDVGRAQPTLINPPITSKSSISSGVDGGSSPAKLP